MLNQITLTKR